MKKKVMVCIMIIFAFGLCIAGSMGTSASNRGDTDNSRKNAICKSQKNSLRKKNKRKWYEISNAGKDDKHEFNISPDKTPDKWEEINSYQEKIDVCQVSEKTADQMSTEGLVDTCLEYPLFGDMMLFENIQEGFSNISSNFNGLEELMAREDSGEYLYEIYKSLDFEKLLGLDDYPLLRLKYLETIIAQEDVLSSMDKSTREDLLKVCIDYFKIKITKYADKLDPIPTFWIITRILKMDNSEFREFIKSNAAFKEFEKNGVFINVTNEDVDVVINSIIKAME